MSRSLIPNSTQIPDVILDHWMAHLSGAEFKVVLYIARRTYGFGKDSDTISLNQLARGIRTRNGSHLDYGTGLSRSSVKSACASLVARGVLIKTQATVAGSEEPDENTYRLNLYAPIVLDDDPDSEEMTSGGFLLEVGQKMAHVGQKMAYLQEETEVGQKLAHVGQKLAHHGSEIGPEVGQKLAPQETDIQETDIQETAAAITSTEPLKPEQIAKGSAADLNGVGKRKPDPETLSLIAALVEAELNSADAERLARARPEEAWRQLRYLPFKTDLENPGGYLRRAIEGGFPPPKEYKAAQAKEERERKKHEEAERRRAAEAARSAVEAAKAVGVDLELSRLENGAPQAFSAFLRYVADKRDDQLHKLPGISERGRMRIAAEFERPEKRRELFLAWREAMGEQAPAPTT